MTSPYKGQPKSEWPRIKGEQIALKQAQADARRAAAEVPRETSPATDSFSEDKTATKRPSFQPEAMPPDLFSGEMKSLEVFGLNGSTTNPLPGYRLYWFTDEHGNGDRISRAKRSGWEFVERSEIALNDDLVGNVNLGSHVTKVANKHVMPVEYCYLMKKPRALDEYHMAQRNQQLQRQKEQLARGRISDNPQDRQYVPGDAGPTSAPRISIDSKLFR